MKIIYTKQGGYLLQDLTLKATKKGNINKYGRMRLTYLKEHKKALYITVLMENYKKSGERLSEKRGKKSNPLFILN